MPPPHALQREHPDADDKEDWHDPGQQVAQEGAFDLPGDHHAALLKLTCEVGLDAGGDEHWPAVDRLLEGSLDEAVGYRHLRYPALVKVGLELAVGNLRHLGGGGEEILERHQEEEGGDPVPDVELRFLVHFHCGRSRLSHDQQKAAAIAKQFQR